MSDSQAPGRNGFVRQRRTARAANFRDRHRAETGSNRHRAEQGSSRAATCENVDARYAPRTRFVRVRRYLRRAWSFAPRMGTTIAIGIGTLGSLAPGLLPRTPEAQAVLMGLLTALALAMTGMLRLILRTWGLYTETTRMRRLALAATALLIVGAAVHAGTSQNKLRATMGTPLIGAEYWLRCAVGAAVIAGVLFGLAKGLGWLLRSLRHRRSARRHRRALREPSQP